MKYLIKAHRPTAIRYWVWQYGLRAAIERAHLSAGQQWVSLGRTPTKGEAQWLVTQVSMAEAYIAGRLKRPMAAWVRIER